MSDAPLNIADEFAPTGVDAWKALLAKDLKGKPFDVLVTKVDAGLELQPLYTKEQAADESKLGVPGVAPFVRGTSPLGKSERGWLIQQEYDDPRMEVARDAIAADLARGAHGAWIRVGVDQGVRILTAGDLDLVLRGVDLARHSVCLEPESDFLGVAASLVALADAKNIARGALVGSFGADPLGTLARTGNLSNGLDGSMGDAMELASFARNETPNVRAMLANSRPYAEAGATAVHELAWTIATGVVYLRRLVDAGLTVEDASRQLSFALSVSGPFFVDIAKLRAARWLWSKVVAASGGSEEAQAMHLHVRTSSFTMSQRDPWVNMLRTTTESFAAAVGGADSIATLPFDAAVGPSDEFARRVARNQQIILRDEANLHRVADPAGGSWFVDSLTEQLARAAWAELVAVEALGGMEKALTLGHVARTLDATTDKLVGDIKRRKLPLVGVSEFPNLGESMLDRKPVDFNAVEGELGHPFGQASQDNRHRALMDFARVAQSRERRPGELVTRAITATGLGVDLFSLSAVQRMGRPSVYVEPIAWLRAPMVFESLRDASDRMLAQRGRRPLAALLCLGSVAQHTARATWIRNVLAAGGIEAVDVVCGADASAALDAYANSGSDMAVICGPDELYETWVPEVAGQLRGKGARVVALAGKPGDKEATYREKGVDTFIYAGLDLHSILVTFHMQLGVSR